MRLRIRLLGPPEVTVDGEPVRITGRPGVLLLTLAISAGRVVSLDRLVAAVWGEEPPENPRGSLRTVVKRVRGLIGAENVETHPAGYMLCAGPDEVDALRFLQLLDQAASTSDSASERRLLSEALGLWRGVPFEGVASAWLAESQAPWLIERHLAATERRIDLEMAHGARDGLAAELRVLLARHPLRESLWVRLLTVLDLTGRRAEALEQYETIRRQIADELGVAPGPRLRAMHAKLIAADTAPQPPRGTAAGVSRPAEVEPVPAARVVPRQLPPDVAGFVGREEILAMMDHRLGDAAAPLLITAIGGAAGIGKTSLAVHWAHRVVDRFPDGQLYANLRGFDPAGPPRTPEEVLRGFLEALEVPAAQLPSDFEAQLGLYRSVLAGRRVLIVLDNARDSAQVRPLLPGSPGIQVVITSRDRLAGLVAVEGARPVLLDVLSIPEARELLSARLGPQRVHADPAAVEAIITRCAGLPLALAIVAARAALLPDAPLRTIAGQLSRDAQSLDAFAVADKLSDVRAVFSWSYLTLSEGAGRLFRLLGLPSGADIGVRAVASLAGLPMREIGALLAELVGGQLLAEPSPGRYTMHDLLRAYAAELAQAVDPQQVRDDATRRLLDHYRHSAYRAAVLLDPHRDPLTLADPDPGVTVAEPADTEAAMQWLEAEQKNLLKAIQWAGEAGFDTHVWELAWALAEYIDMRGQWHDALSTLLAARDAIHRLNDPAREAGIRRQLARVYRALERHDEAQAELRRAFEISGSIGDRLAQARALLHLAGVLEEQSLWAQALEAETQALELARSAGHQRLEALALNGIGWHQAHLGELGPATENCLAALEIQRATGDRLSEASTLDSLGFIRLMKSDHDGAIVYFEQAVALFRQLVDDRGIAESLLRLGDAREAAGDREPARAAWQEAWEIYTALGRAEADRVRERLAGPGDRSREEPARGAGFPDSGAEGGRPQR